MKKKYLIATAIIMVVAILLTGCSAAVIADEKVSSESGAFSVNKYKDPDYDTVALSGGESIVVYNYASLDNQTSTNTSDEFISVKAPKADGGDNSIWAGRFPSYLNGQDYNFESLKNDLSIISNSEEIKIGEHQLIKITSNDQLILYGAEGIPYIITIQTKNGIDNTLVSEFISSLTFNVNIS